MFKGLLNDYRRLSRKPIAFKSDFLKRASLAQADSNCFFFFFPPVFFPFRVPSMHWVFLYDNFERQQCGTKPSLFPLIQ